MEHQLKDITVVDWYPYSIDEVSGYKMRSYLDVLFMHSALNNLRAATKRSTVAVKVQWSEIICR